MPSVGEDVEKLDHAWPADGSVNWHTTTLENSLAVSNKAAMSILYDPAMSL